MPKEHGNDSIDHMVLLEDIGRQIAMWHGMALALGNTPVANLFFALLVKSFLRERSLDDAYRVGMKNVRTGFWLSASIFAAAKVVNVIRASGRGEEDDDEEFPTLEIR